MAKFPADDSAPATKGDLKALALKSDMEALEDRVKRYIDEKLKAQQEDFVHSVKVINEQLIHDFHGAFKDRTEQHSDDIRDLKRRTGRIERHLNLLPTA
ncbi:MAG: hypothetical protein AAB728_00435 [Patescibacteria group bacterium]